MKSLFAVLLTFAAVCVTGCGDQSDAGPASVKSPAFMFWCFRKEIVSSDFYIPDMDTVAEATYLRNRLLTVPGYQDSQSDLTSHMLTINYQSSTIRKMNFEEAIALSGYSANGRPASPNAQIPEGVRE